MKWYLIWFSPLTLCLVCSAQLTTSPVGPAFVDENQADFFLFNGTYIWQDANCNVKTVEGQSNVPDIKISIDYVTTSETCTFNVTLISPIDYEKITTLKIDIIIHQDCSGVEMQQRITKIVIVRNVLDTPPVFINSTYTVRIPENQVINSPIVVNIQAIDADGIDRITYAVNFADKQNSTFQVRLQSNPEILDIFLISSLDFEQHHAHHFTITAIDTMGMNSTCEVIIKVINVQDTPPAFTALQYNGRINEEAKLGSSVLTVSATDGDSVLTQDQWEGTKANQIYYSILSGDAGMFGINSSTGEIITVQELDIDSNMNVTNGLVVLTVMAEELNTSLEPQYGISTATVLILVQIEDANDNRPQFSSQYFTGHIRADAVLGELVTIEDGGYISVFDIDQSPSNNRFSLHIEKDGQPWDVFKPNIETQYAYATVMIQLNRNNSIMDLGDTHVKFQIVAQEYGATSQNFAATKTEMTVWIKARTVPAPPPEPVIDLPLSASDIIVFIAGFLLLLNIGLTIFVCCALKSGQGFPMSPFNRNSKYYVSNKSNLDKNTDIVNKISHAEELGNPDANKLTTDQDSIIRSDTPARSERIQAQVKTSIEPKSNIVTLVTNINQPDVTLLKDKDIIPLDENGAVIAGMEQERNIEIPKNLSADVRDSQIKSQATLMTMLNENNSLNHTVAPSSVASSKDDYKAKISDSALSQQNQLANNRPSNLGPGLSNFLQKVQQKFNHGNKYVMDETDGTFDMQPLHEKSDTLQSGLTETTHINSNSSSFSENATGDGVPLIKSSHVKFQSNLENLQGCINTDLPVTNEEAKDSGKQNKENKRYISFPGTKPEKSILDSFTKETSKENKSILSQAKDKITSQQVSFPFSSNSSTNLTTSHITQTDVPPVALALPFSTGTLNINKEPHTGVINPVYETFATMDNEEIASLTLESPAPGLGSTSAEFGKRNLLLSQPSMPGGKQNLASQTKLSGMNDLSNVTDTMEKRPGSSQTSHDGNSHEPSFVSLQNFTKEKTKQLPNSPLSSAENTQSSPSILIKIDGPDYVTAAKDLLTTTKQDKRPESKPQPKTVTINEDAKQVKKQNITEERFTSF